MVEKAPVKRKEHQALTRKVMSRRRLFFCLMLLLVVNSAYSKSSLYDRTKIYTERTSQDSLAVKVTNKFLIPVSLRAHLFSDNLEGLQDSVIFAIIPPADSGQVIARFKIKDPYSATECTFNWKVVLGDTSKTPDLKYPYRYPYQNWLPFKISQGPGGTFSHKHSFAYDFAMPVGTPITAAREGIVALVKNDSGLGGADEALTDKANVIAIMHPDGTIANYIHLKKGGALVKEGQWVHKGQIIGYSGNTGYTTGPHLHFEVIQPSLQTELKRSIEFKWEPPVYAFLPLYGNYFLNSMFGNHAAYRNMIMG
ncbi:MAG: hypothetical protein K0S09_2544 [Sphingobacteriaceae bacterium]|nr:hypothetical protein [Sphingobacteriaceae bacterium]